MDKKEKELDRRLAVAKARLEALKGESKRIPWESRWKARLSKESWLRKRKDSIRKKLSQMETLSKWKNKLAISKHKEKRLQHLRSTVDWKKRIHDQKVEEAKQRRIKKQKKQKKHDSSGKMGIRMKHQPLWKIRMKHGMRKMSKSPKKQKDWKWRMHHDTQPLYMSRVKKEGWSRDLKEDFPHRVKKPIMGKGFYGGYPSPLGIDKIIDVQLTDLGVRICGHYSGLTYDISRQLRQLMKQIQEFGKIYINTYAPADVGNSSYKNSMPNLRRSLIESLDESNTIVPKLGNNDVNNIQLKMRFFSELSYAGIVNRMPQSSLQHHKSEKEKSWKTGEYLHDPQAKRHFFQYIERQIKNVTRNVLIPYFLDRVHKHVTVYLPRIKRDRIRKMFSIRELGRGAF